MRFTIAALAFAAAASAQKIGACDGKAQACIDEAMVGTCDAGDYACACANMSELQGKATPCVIDACGGAAGAVEVIEEVQAMCENIGGEEPPTEPTPSGEEPPAETTGSGEEPPADTTAAEEPPTETDTPCDVECGGDGDDGDATEPPQPTESFPTAGAGSIAPVGAVVAGLLAFAL